MTIDDYYRRKKEGLCTICGLPIPDDWKHTTCEFCYFKEKRRRDEGNERNKIKKYMENREKPKGMSIDEMAKEAHERHITYGQLQRLKMLGKEEQ